MSIIAAIRQRRLFQVAAVYAVVAWLVVQVVVAVEDPLSLPGWFDTATIVLLAAGFPIALILAWGHANGRADARAGAPGADVPDPGRAGQASAGTGSAREAAAGTGGVREAASGTGGAREASADTRRAAAAPTRSVRFCTSPDGARIAFTTLGAGAPVVKTANWLSHIELDIDTPIYGHLIRDLAARFQLTVYDERLSGLSDWKADEVSLDAFVEDMESVRRAAGLDRFSILAYSQGCAVSVAYAARYADRVERLVLYGGFARNFREGANEVEAIATLIESGWGRDNPAFRQIFTTSLIPKATTEESESLNDLMRASATAENAARLFRVIHSIDVRPLAAEVRAPTLVLHCRDEAGVPSEYGRELAALIPGARFVGLPGENHLLLERDEAYPIFKDEVFAFLARQA